MSDHSSRNSSEQEGPSSEEYDPEQYPVPAPPAPPADAGEQLSVAQLQELFLLRRQESFGQLLRLQLDTYHADAFGERDLVMMFSPQYASLDDHWQHLFWFLQGAGRVGYAQVQPNFQRINYLLRLLYEKRAWFCLITLLDKQHYTGGSRAIDALITAHSLFRLDDWASLALRMDARWGDRTRLLRDAFDWMNVVDIEERKMPAVCLLMLKEQKLLDCNWFLHLSAQFREFEHFVFARAVCGELQHPSVYTEVFTGAFVSGELDTSLRQRLLSEIAPPPEELERCLLDRYRSEAPYRRCELSAKNADAARELFAHARVEPWDFLEYLMLPFERLADFDKLPVHWKRARERDPVHAMPLRFLKLCQNPERLIFALWVWRQQPPEHRPNTQEFAAVADQLHHLYPGDRIVGIVCDNIPLESYKKIGIAFGRSWRLLGTPQQRDASPVRVENEGWQS